jgi:Protein of unknown function (DUF3293)
MRPSLLRAYGKTCYEAGGIEVRIGCRSPAMDRMLLLRGVREAVLVTAYNPYSRVMPRGWNERMQVRLAQRLRRRSTLAAEGSWRCWSEAHLLVFGDVRLARPMARLFRQNAIVIVRLGQPARLLLTSRFVACCPLPQPQ